MTGKPRVLVLDDYEGAVAASTDLAALSDRVEVMAVRHHVEGEDLDRLVDGVSMVIAIRERTRFDAATVARLGSVELLLQTGGHAYHVDVDAATDHGIMVALGRGSRSPAPVIGELVVGLMIAWYRRLIPAIEGMRAGDWPATLGRLLHGRTLGVLGFGRHGATVARLARGLGMQVLAWSPSLTPERAAVEGAEATEYDELLTRADVVSVHLRLTPDTIGIIGTRELELMGPSTFLINTSRGPIVDESALIEAVRSDTIEGAALDVFDTEPLETGHPLRTFDNVLCTPHLGYTVDAAFADFAATSAKQLRDYLAHELDPALVLNPNAGRTPAGRWGGLREDC